MSKLYASVEESQNEQGNCWEENVYLPSSPSTKRRLLNSCFHLQDLTSLLVLVDVSEKHLQKPEVKTPSGFLLSPDHLHVVNPWRPLPCNWLAFGVKATFSTELFIPACISSFLLWNNISGRELAIILSKRPPLINRIYLIFQVKSRQLDAFYMAWTTTPTIPCWQRSRHCLSDLNYRKQFW